MRICVVGKRGAGKSIVAGTIARLLAQRGERVLALDADPMPGMARSLGTQDTPEPLLADAVERKNGGPWRLKRGIGPVTAVRRYAREAPDGVLMLQLGKITLEDHPDFLAATQAFWQLVHRLPEVSTFDDWALIGDTPAGPRQIAADFAVCRHARLSVATSTRSVAPMVWTRVRFPLEVADDRPALSFRRLEQLLWRNPRHERWTGFAQPHYQPHDVAASVPKASRGTLFSTRRAGP